MPARFRQVKKATGEGKVGSAQPLDLNALKESEERFRRTFELAGSGLAHIGMDRRFMRVNRRLCEILGYPEHELLKLRGKDISHPEDADVINQQRPRLYSGELDEVRLEKRYVRKDGQVVWVNFAMVVERDAEGHPKYEIAVYDDITARKAAEQALGESEARFRRTFQLAGSGLAHVSMEGRFLRVNPRVCEMFGYSESELTGLAVKDLSHPEDRDLADAPRAKVVRGELDSARLEKRYVRKDGSVIWAKIAIALERDAANKPLYAISVLDDVTARKQAEEALRDTEEHWRAIVNSANEGMLVYDHSLRITAANVAAERILGLPLGELIGAAGFSTLLQCVRADGAPLAAEDRPSCITLATGEPQTGLVLGVKRPGGSITWLSANTAFLRRPGEKQHYGIVSTISDITDRRAAEEALRHSEELFRKTFELAASGIAHVGLDGRFMRVNRRLTEMLGYTEGELIGRSVKEISHPEDRNVTDAQRELVRAGQRESVRFEKRYLAKRGESAVGEPGRGAGARRRRRAALRDRDVRRHHRAQAGRSGAARGARGAEAQQRGARAVRLRRLARPAGAAAHGVELHAAAGAALQARSSTATPRVHGLHRRRRGAHEAADRGPARLLARRHQGQGVQDRRARDARCSARSPTCAPRSSEAGAAVTYDPLPTVPADEVQLAQLFQNLIGNALKFRGAVGAAHPCRRRKTRTMPGSSRCATTASASSRSTSSASSWCSSACTTRANIPAPASASPSARRSSSATAAASGSSRSRARAARSSSRCRNNQKEAAHGGHDEAAPVEILLVEDNPGDERLTREALKEGKVYSNLHWVKDGVEAMEFLRREGKYARTRRARTSSCSTSTCRRRTAARCCRRSRTTRR